MAEPTVSLVVDGKTVHSYTTTAVPREGEQVVIDGKTRRIKAVTWSFGDSVDVNVEVADESYTF